MRIVLLSLICVLSLVACQNKDSKTGDLLEEALEEGKTGVDLIGADVDAHGCKQSAGFTWSQLRGDCIRIFEEGIMLLPVDLDESKAVYAAFVLYNNAKTEIELFLPTKKESILLSKTDKNTFEKDTLKYDDKTKNLYIDGEVKYTEDQS